MATYEIRFDSCDSRSQEQAAKQFLEMKNAAMDFFSEIGANVEVDPCDSLSLIVRRDDGRGLLASVRTFCSKNVYWELA